MATAVADITTTLPPTMLLMSNCIAVLAFVLLQLLPVYCLILILFYFLLS